MATVVNMKDRPDLRAALEGANEHGDVVRIDRRTRWGNPFVIGRHGNREEVIERYRNWLWGKVKSGGISLSELAALNGKTLACHCHPLPCHGDVLAKAASWASCAAGWPTGPGSQGRRSRRRSGRRRSMPASARARRRNKSSGQMREMATNHGRARLAPAHRWRERRRRFLRPRRACRAANRVPTLARLQRLERDRGSRVDGAGAAEAPGCGRAPPPGVAEVPGEGAGPARAQRGYPGRPRYARAGARDGVLDRGRTGRGRHRDGDPPCQALPAFRFSTLPEWTCARRWIAWTGSGSRATAVTWSGSLGPRAGIRGRKPVRDAGAEHERDKRDEDWWMAEGVQQARTEEPRKMTRQHTLHL